MRMTRRHRRLRMLVFSVRAESTSALLKPGGHLCTLGREERWVSIFSSRCGRLKLKVQQHHCAIEWRSLDR